jgi:ribose transport system permease protein
MPEPRLSRFALGPGARIALLALLVASTMSVLAPNFATSTNAVTILKATATTLPSLVGFTLVLVVGQLDLSFAAVFTLGAMLTVGEQPTLGWWGAGALAIVAGALVGLVNGVLVTWARINAFIVTLGTLTMVQGAVQLYGKGATIARTDFALADLLDTPSVTAPRIVVPVVLALLAEVALRATPWGRSLLLTGGSERAAWYAGIRTSRLVTIAFVLSGALAALGGMLTAMSLASANPTLGSPSLMLVISAVIIGGASMTGGRGRIVNGAVALLALTMLTNGLGAMGAGVEVQLIASGAVLALAVLVDAIGVRRAERWRGARPWLLQSDEAASAAPSRP